MRIPQWLLYCIVAPSSTLVCAKATASKEIFSKAAYSSPTSNLTSSDPRNPSYKWNVMRGLFKAQSYSPSADLVLLHEVRNSVRGGPSISMPDFVDIDLDVIIVDRGVPTLATLQGDLNWGRWRDRLVDFLPFDVGRLQEGVTVDQIAAILDEDEALLNVILKGLAIPFDIIQLCRPIMMGIRTLVYVFNAPPQRPGTSRRYLSVVAEGPYRRYSLYEQMNICLSPALQNVNFSTNALEASTSTTSL